jgi:hypothetical protein
MSGAYIVWVVAIRLAGRKLHENNGFCGPMLYFLVRLRVASRGKSWISSRGESISVDLLAYDQLGQDQRY